MVIVNIMIVFASLLFYAVLGNYNSLTNPVAWGFMVLVFILANGPQLIKVGIYKDKAPSVLSRFIGTIIVVFILGLSVNEYLNLWNTLTGISDKVFLVWTAIVALFMVYVPISHVSKLDKKIADKLHV